jgi:geranylgeranyl diphosphate synthase type I
MLESQSGRLERSRSSQLTETSFLADVNRTALRTFSARASDLLLQMAIEQLTNIGKQLRPRLVYGLGQAFEVDSSHLIGWATACEILHNATLVHDDLQDGDQWRRGIETIWKRFGVAQAVNLGDFLILVAPLPLFESEIEPSVQVAIARLYSVTAARIVNGQSFEPLLNEMRSIATLEEDYLKCIAQKTSALFAGIARGVAIIAQRDEAFQAQIESLFFDLGAIFQIQDDILDLFGDKRRETKGCDIKEGKVSFLVVTHLKNYPDDLNLIRSILTKPREQTSENDVQIVSQLFEQRGTLATALNELKELIARVRNAEVLEMESKLADFVRGFAAQVLLPIQHLGNLSW